MIICEDLIFRKRKELSEWRSSLDGSIFRRQGNAESAGRLIRFLIAVPQVDHDEIACQGYRE